MLLDTASLYFRAFYGVPDSLRAPDGTSVNAVRGLLDFLSTLITAYAPTSVACCWDNDWRPTWRVELIDTYKTHRLRTDQDGLHNDQEEVPDGLEQQIPIIQDVLRAVGIPVIGVDHYEADDVIATLAAAAESPVDIVTGDRDLFQLVNDKDQIRVLYTSRGVRNHDVITSIEVQQRFGVTPQQYVDFAVLRGDASDGLPGVKGIGDKTAAKLINEYQDLEHVLQAAAQPESELTKSVRNRLLDAQDYLAAATRVVRVATNLPVSSSDLDLPQSPANPDELQRLQQQWGLGGSVDRLLATLASQ